MPKRSADMLNPRRPDVYRDQEAGILWGGMSHACVGMFYPRRPDVYRDQEAGVHVVV